MTQQAVVDLMDFCTEEMADLGIDIEIFDPRGNPMGLIINMKGSDSQTYLDVDRKIKNRNIETAKRKRDFTVGMDPETTEANLIERMKACFNFWKQKTGEDAEGNPIYKDTIRIGGQELPSNKNEFGKLIARRGFFFIRQQVQEGMDKTANFLPKVQTASAPTPSSPTNMTDPEKKE